jgi:Mlc titration factor MtfA (ptsG expression regulator)
VGTLPPMPMWSLVGLWRRRKRKGLAKRPFPEAWLPILRERLPFAQKLEGDERARFLEHLKLFVWEKNWEGIGGVELDDEMRVVIAGCAARLSRNVGFHVYDVLESVVVAPSDLQVHKAVDVKGRILGLAHRFGTVVFAWDAVKHGIANTTDGLNTALHEFAHIIDLSGGAFDGTPRAEDLDDLHAFANVFARHYLELRHEPKAGIGKVLRDYGATNEAEFFAVATEAFFEKPSQLKRRAPELYAVLVDFYGTDPATA